MSAAHAHNPWAAHWTIIVRTWKHWSDEPCPEDWSRPLPMSTWRRAVSRPDSPDKDAVEARVKRMTERATPHDDGSWCSHVSVRAVPAELDKDTDKLAPPLVRARLGD